MYTCEEHDSTFVGKKCPSCVKIAKKRNDLIFACLLCFICFFVIAYNFGILVTLYSLIAGAASYLVAEAKFKNDQK